MTALRRSDDLAQPIGPTWLQNAMLDFTALGGVSVLTLLTILAVGLLLAQRKWWRALFLVGAISGGALLNAGLKIGFARERPDLVAHLVKVHDLSFPSGHAMNSAVVYLTIGVLLARAEKGPRVKAYLLGGAVLLTLLVGCSRVYLGVHFPTDVLAGWTVGASWATLCWLVAEWWRQRGTRV
ncbi:phosphatase PAP2 family protein [Glacieibacterium frigidum]|uniref:Phosphatase PAP2 family protein n=2 Tax=Glacieibacterium frigidum TaxID=2593303 RepID=A0A552UJJ7_9SPHN|nr:phosphatase PAP2 family protein [Glacieibacterium frigidum]